MKRKFTKLTLAVALTAGAVLASGTTNPASATTATKHTKHAKHGKNFLFFSANVECNPDGSAGVVYRFCGIRLGGGDSVPNSALCQ
ncbi:hypothetical protein GKZ68_20505 (plasmid) [Hymenobacter sp. BRD128]|uniref:hypothetical protein n=1 Tax=Hymenobacter sp. BRD128 TaxID=2675878 RepID=UPI0015644BDF|nr:hypothetical protein [Hymenobacter sp. BRD128]QKG59066.1 hypothetical protein GKZ68_20505 [Hymenobacter sp. BRD128]